MRPKKKECALKIEQRLGEILGKYFLGIDDIHHGYWTEGMKVELKSYPEALKNYVDFIFMNLPEKREKILSAGRGNLSLINKLLDSGSSVDVISSGAGFMRSDDRIKGKCRILKDSFKDFDSARGKYDLLIFCESFQEMRLHDALEKASEIIAPGGFILICDFFKNPVNGLSLIDGGHEIEDFYGAIEESHCFRIIKDIDITEQTAPTWELAYDFYSRVAMPARNFMKSALYKKYPWFFAAANRVLNVFFWKEIDKLNWKYFSGLRNANNFKTFKTYRLFLIARSED
jgi:hypothetical protein